jgi:acyl dehydratase
MSTTIAPLPAAPITLRAGDTMTEDQVGPLSRTDFVRYAGAGGDLNPIHHDDEFARAAGMPSVFGMGMLHAGILGTRLARWVGPNSIRTFTVRFSGQVWPGDVLTFAGHVDAVDGQLAEISMTVTRQTGDVAMSAKATALVT